MQQAAFEPNNIRAGHWAEPGQDSAGPRVLLRRCAPGAGSGSTTSRSRSTHLTSRCTPTPRTG